MNNMRSRWMLILALTLMISSVLADEGALQITGTFEEDNIKPGEEALFHLNFENLGSPKATTMESNMKITRLIYDITLPNGIRFIDSSDAGIVKVGYVNPLADVDHYIPLRILNSTTYNDYQIEVYAEYNIAGHQHNVTAEFLLNIRDKPKINLLADYVVEDIGKDFNYIFMLENSAKQSIKNPVISVDLSGNSVALYGSEFVLDDIDAGEVIEVSIPMIAGIDATPGVIDFDIMLDYVDLYGNEYSETYPVGIVLGGNTEFLVQLEETNPKVLKKNNVGEFTLNVANIGSLEAGSVEIEVLENEEIITNTKTKDYLSNLNRGDYTSTTFEIIPTEEGEIDIELIISYTNTYGMRVSEEKSFSLSVGNSLFDTKTQQAANPGIPIAGIIGVVFVISAGAFIIYYYLKNKRKRRK